MTYAMKLEKIANDYNKVLKYTVNETNRYEFSSTAALITFQFCMWLSRQHKNEWEWCESSRKWLAVKNPYTKEELIIMCDHLDANREGILRGRDGAILQIFGEQEQLALEIPSPIVDLGTPDVPGCAQSYFAQTPRVSSWNEGFGNKRLVKIANKRPRLEDI